MEETKKLEAIADIVNATGGSFTISYDEEGITKIVDCIGDNKAAYNASKLNDFLCDAVMQYINWRSQERFPKEPRVTEKI